ncbi:MAG: hydroxypyruvate isomerase family protein [Spirochaetia bacterium]
MITLSACVEAFFAELPYPERIRRVAGLGFTAYEFWFPDKRFNGRGLIEEKKDFDQLAELNARHGLTAADFVFNHPDGGIVASLVDARDRQKLRDGIEETIGLAKKIGCRALISGSGNTVPGLSRTKALDSMVESLSLLAPVCRSNGITLLVEPFNSRVDHPDCFLDDPETCAEVLRAVNSPSVKMLFDIYHMQIMHGDILSFVTRNLPAIGHFHVAGVPGRHEPSPCELDYPFILKEIDALGYAGYFGLEYWPAGDPEESLRRTMRALAPV